MSSIQLPARSQLSRDMNTYLLYCNEARAACAQLTAFPCSCSVLCPAAQGGKRPDVSIIKNKMVLGIFEDKTKQNFESAEIQLREYVKRGLQPGYQEVQAIHVVAVSGTEVELGLCDVSGKVSDWSHCTRVTKVADC
jgi:hypothetical protein